MEPSCAASSFFSCCSAALRFTPNRGLSAACSTTRCRGAWPWYHWEAGPRRPQCAIRTSLCWWYRKTWIAIVGIPLKSAPGPHQVTTSDGRTLSFTVGTKHYREQHIKLKNSRQVNPLAEDMTRINRELAEQTRAYQTFSPAQPSNLLFDKPVQGPLSSPFGLRRFFNGEERNPHSGLDFAVGAGTPIKAPAAGKVILIGNYFFNGNTVFVDHGQGLISMFCHMSKVDVKLGQSLPRGGIVGRVGATGRATGPHMHWNVSLNDARVDPAIFIGAFKP